MPDQQRFEDQAEPPQPAAIAPRRVERMVKKAHFPLGIRFREAFVEPLQLRAIEIRRVEGEELHAGRDLGEEILGRREAVVTLAVHVEER